MKKFIILNVLVLWGVFLMMPQAVHANINGASVSASGNKVTVSLSMDSIEDIKGCTLSTCPYWQMVFEKQEVFDTITYHRYYSSDVYPASQLRAAYTFDLPAGDYSDFSLEGFTSNEIGDCGYEDYSAICPDGNHVVGGEMPGRTPRIRRAR